MEKSASEKAIGRVVKAYAEGSPQGRYELRTMIANGLANAVVRYADKWLREPENEDVEYLSDWKLCMDLCVEAGDLWACCALGNYYERAGNLVGACKTFSRALTIKPSCKLAEEDRGYCLLTLADIYQDLGEAAKRREVLIVAVKSGEAEACIDLGHMYRSGEVADGKYDAQSLYDKAAALRAGEVDWERFDAERDMYLESGKGFRRTTYSMHGYC